MLGRALPRDRAGSKSDSEDDVIVVTGPLLRGIAPVGTNVVSVSEEDVVATGATSANDLLASM